jgi:ankyrin repeat protein
VLANAGAPLENRSPDGYMPIHWAVKSGNYDAMMFLINKGVDVNAKCGQGYSVLDWAKNEGYTRLIAYLKKHGAKNTPAYIKEFGR